MLMTQDRFTSLTHCIADVLDSYGMVNFLRRWNACAKR
jgi:hypothetical protein